MDEIPRLYKWLQPDGRCLWGKLNCYWSLPRKPGEPGNWMPALRGKKPLEACLYGYHAFSAEYLCTLVPLQPAALVEVELREPERHGDKWLARQGRIVRVIFPVNASLHFSALHGRSYWEHSARCDAAYEAFYSQHEHAVTVAGSLLATQLAASRKQYRQEIETLFEGAIA